MGTRGTYGLRKNDKDKLAYNHSDSYPEWLGDKIVKAIREMGIDRLNTLYKLIEMVDETDKITKLHYERAIRTGIFTHAKEVEQDSIVTMVGQKSYYSLLRSIQGDLFGHEKVGLMIDNGDFIYDSLFCEWGYIINLDTNMLEVYKGFQGAKHTDGRYADGKPKPYTPHYEGASTLYPCRLIAEFPLDDIPDNWLKDWTSDDEDDESDADSSA